MSLRTLEREILAAARVASMNQTLRLRDILEWSSSHDHVLRNLRDSEVAIELGGPMKGFWVAILKEKDKRRQVEALHY